MLPRRQIREAFYALYSPMTTVTTKDRGRLNRYHEEDLPAINVTTYEDRRLDGESVHGGCKILTYEQDVQLEIYSPASSNFEDDIEIIEEDLWQAIAPLDIPGVEIVYQGSSLTPVKDADTPQAVRILSLTAEYSVDQANPDVIIT